MKKILIILLSLLTLSGCIGDKPPVVEAVKALDGEYVSPIGSLCFNGDGDSVVLKLDEEYKEKLGYTSEKGTYAFTIDHRGACDYDKANLFRIFIDDIEISFEMPIGETDFEQIVIFEEAGSLATVTFERK